MWHYFATRDDFANVFLGLENFTEFLGACLICLEKIEPQHEWLGREEPSGVFEPRLPILVWETLKDGLPLQKLAF